MRGYPPFIEEILAPLSKEGRADAVVFAQIYFSRAPLSLWDDGECQRLGWTVCRDMALHVDMRRMHEEALRENERYWERYLVNWCEKDPCEIHEVPDYTWRSEGFPTKRKALDFIRKLRRERPEAFITLGYEQPVLDHYPPRKPRVAR